MHPPNTLGDSLDPACIESPQSHLALSSASLTEYDFDAGQETATPSFGGDVDADTLNSSAVSLGPSISPSDGRRKLLLIYIHGFMGAEDSFRRFPAHVHNIVASSLAESHVVYSKVYPRYKSRRAMNIARDEFSEWIIPHESHQTDVILLGHSLGGILAAEVALAEAKDVDSPRKHRHHILGTINFDVPFLGMHPSVVGTGLATLFQPKHKDESSKRNKNSPAYLKSSASLARNQSLQESIERIPSWFDQAPDSNFDPPFPNDVRRAKRSQLDGAFHFLKKNSGNLTMAVKEYASSYVEFGSCLADYSSLRRRYSMLKELETIDDMEPKHDRRGRLQRRLRFTNYYTASPGFPKEPPSNIEGQSLADDATSSSQTAATTESLENLTKLPTPALSVESYDSSDDDITEIEPTPIEDPHILTNMSSSDLSYDILSEQPTIDREAVESNDEYTTVLESLPPLPEIPSEPPALDPSLYKDKDILKQARKEHARLVKLYERAKKEHDITLKEREKLVQKLGKKKQKSLPSAPLETESTENCDGHDTATGLGDHIEQTSSIHESAEVASAPSPIPQLEEKTAPNDSAYSISETASVKTPKDRVFCALPGSSDRLWVRIFMPDIDEVVAHQSIFIPNGLYYEWLVNDTAARIEQWVQDDSTRRVIWEQFGETA